MLRILSLLAILAATPVAAQSLRLDAQWPQTDFSKSTVDLGDIRSGGPGRDGIPAVDDPRFLRANTETRLSPREPVITVEFGPEPRAYPVRYFMVHEIVNDRINGQPVAVTFCPLCNSAMVFDARVEGRALRFGVTGNLRHSDMVMYDRQTESWWQQALGTSIVGELAGTELTQLPSWMESWESFLARNPGGLVMDAPRRDGRYGTNPYVRYDSAARPFLYDGALPPGGIDPMARVVRVGNQAWPLTRLTAEREITHGRIRLIHVGDQASALDSADIRKGRAVGSVRVQDAQGRDLPHDVMFAFAFHAMFPSGTWHN